MKLLGKVRGQEPKGPCHHTGVSGTGSSHGSVIQIHHMGMPGTGSSYGFVGYRNRALSGTGHHMALSDIWEV